MSNLLELLNKVLRQAGQREVSNLANLSTPVTQTLDFINHTYSEMLQVLKVNYFLKESSFTTVPLMAEYTISDGTDATMILSDSVYLDESQILPADYTVAQNNPSLIGKPTFFYFKGQQLILYPIPDAEYSIRFSYRATPRNLTASTDLTELPESWERVLIYGALSLLEKFLGEPNSEHTFFLYRQGLSQLKIQSPLKAQPRMKGFYQGYSQ